MGTEMDRNKALLGILAVVGLAYLVCPRPAPPQSKTLPTYLQPIPKWNEQTIPPKLQTLLRPRLQSPQKLQAPSQNIRFYSQRFQSARAHSSRIRHQRLQTSRRISEVQRRPASQLIVPAAKKARALAMSRQQQVPSKLQQGSYQLGSKRGSKTLQRSPASRSYAKLPSKARVTVASSARR